MSLRQGCVGEAVGSYLLLFVSVATIVYSQDRGGITSENQLQIAIMVGTTVSVLLFIFTGVSGAHFNMCFSWACAISNSMSWFRCLCYSISQIVGMIAGTLTVRLLSPALFERANGAANMVQPPFSSGQAFWAEAFITFYVFFMCFACMDGPRSATPRNGEGRAMHVRALFPLVVGAAVTSALFLAIPVSSGCLNTSRALAVAAVSGRWEHISVFIFGPYVGATLCAIVYVGLFAHKDWHAAFVEQWRCHRRSSVTPPI